MTGDRCVFQFLRRSVDGKHLFRFQRVWRSVESEQYKVRLVLHFLIEKYFTLFLGKCGFPNMELSNPSNKELNLTSKSSFLVHCNRALRDTMT